jgi:hypothetical protein
MKPVMIVGILLLLAGIISLAFGGFSYTDEHTALKAGPIAIDVKEDKRVSIPLWASLGIAAAGVALVGIGARKS